jgi:hypothetical protein
MADIVAQTARLALTTRSPENAMTTLDMESSAADFDFFVGKWTVRHRRLKERLAGSTQWEEFGGNCVMHKLIDGHGNVDDNVIELPGGHYRAVSLRAFDPKTRRWAIWWVDGRDPHRLDPPLVGSFSRGSGTFYADDVFKGQPIRVRYRWSDITATSCHWEQAFSPDDGKTWETNWITDFTRVR